jgi:hypothetical protein
MRAIFVGLVLSLVWTTGAASQQIYEIELPDRVVRLSSAEWRELPAREPFAVRFEARTARPGEVFPQQLTIFKLPMQVNDRVGVAVTANEVADFLFLYPVYVTCRMRLDRDVFWVESLQTFAVPPGMPLRVPWRLNQRASEDEAFVLLDTYDTDVKHTRFRLLQLFSNTVR